MPPCARLRSALASCVADGGIQAAERLITCFILALAQHGRKVVVVVGDDGHAADRAHEAHGDLASCLDRGGQVVKCGQRVAGRGGFRAACRCKACASVSMPMPSVERVLDRLADAGLARHAPALRAEPSVQVIELWA